MLRRLWHRECPRYSRTPAAGTVLLVAAPEILTSLRTSSGLTGWSTQILRSFSLPMNNKSQNIQRLLHHSSIITSRYTASKNQDEASPLEGISKVHSVHLHLISLRLLSSQSSPYYVLVRSLA